MIFHHMSIYEPYKCLLPRISLCLLAMRVSFWISDIRIIPQAVGCLMRIIRSTHHNKGIFGKLKRVYVYAIAIITSGIGAVTSCYLFAASSAVVKVGSVISEQALFWNNQRSR